MSYIHFIYSKSIFPILLSLFQWKIITELTLHLIVCHIFAIRCFEMILWICNFRYFFTEKRLSAWHPPGLSTTRCCSSSGISRVNLSVLTRVPVVNTSLIIIINLCVIIFTQTQDHSVPVFASCWLILTILSDCLKYIFLKVKFIIRIVFNMIECQLR